MIDFIASNLDFAFFVYGLGYLMAAVLSLSLPRSNRGLRWDLFGIFCGLIGLVAWLNWLALAFGDQPWFTHARLITMTLSFLMLMEFSRSSLVAMGMRFPARWLYPPLAIVSSVALFTLPEAVKVVPRYTLGFLGGGLSAWVFWRAGKGNREMVAPLGCLAAVMAGFTLVSGLIAPRTSFFPANVLNPERIYSALGISVPAVRASLAVLTALMLAWYYSTHYAREAQPSGLLPRAQLGGGLVISLIGILGIGWLVTREAGRLEFRKIMEQQQSRALVAGAAIEIHDLKQLMSVDSSERHASELILREKLRKLGEAAPDIKSLSICTEQDDGVSQIVIREPAQSSQGRFLLGLCLDDDFPESAFDLGQGVLVHHVPGEDHALIETRLTPFGDSFVRRWVLRMEVETSSWRKDIYTARALPLGLTLLFACAYLVLNLARQRAREKSRQAILSEERYRTLVESAPTGILVMDAEGRVLSANRSAEHLLAPKLFLTQRLFADLWPEEVRQKVRVSLERALGGERVELELRTVIEGERAVSCRAVLNRIPDESGIVTRIVGILTDVSEQHLAREETRRSEERYQQLFDDSLVGNYITSPDGRIWLCNQRFADILGFESPWEAMRSSAYGLYPNREERARFIALIEQQKRIESYESELVRKDGRKITVLENVVGRFDENGHLVSLQGTLLDITDRKRVQEELHNALEMVRAVIDASPYAVLMVDTNNSVRMWNPASEKMFGWSAEEVLGKPLPIVFEAGQETSTESRLTLSGDIYLNRNVRLQRRDGTAFDASLSTAPVHGTDGRVMGHVGIVADISETLRAERAMRQSEERYRQLAQASPDAITLLDLTGTIQWCNPQKAQMYGFDDPSELIGTNAMQLLAPEERARAAQHLANALEIRDGQRQEYTLLRRDGSRFTGEFRVVPLRNDEGAISNLLTIAQDVTERNRAAEALRLSEERYRRIIETAQEGVWILDRDGCTTFANRTLAEILGVSVEELQGRSITEFFDGEMRATAFELLAGAGTENFRGTDFHLWRPDGEERWVILRASPIQTGEGASEGTLVMVTDITDRKRSERIQGVLLRISEATSESLDLEELLGRIRSLLSELLDTTNFYVALYDEKTDEYSFEYFADEFDEMAIGERRRLPRSLTDYVRKTGTALLADEQTFEALVAQGEVELIGTPSPVWLGVPLRTAQGVVGVMALQSYTDSRCYDQQDREVLSVVSGHVAMAIERKRALEALLDSQEQLRQAQKMEAIGRLAGGVAHDFNNLLTGILGYSEITMHLLGAESPLRENIEQIARSAERAAGLTRQLLAFSRKQVMQPRIMCVNDVVSDMQKMLRRLIGEDIELIVNLDPELWRVRADPGQIEQVIMNLAVNARDAMPQGGRVTIETRNVDLSSVSRRDLSGVEPGKYVILSVRDTGTGIAPDVIGHIFEPFFTTKERGKGTGLGLSTVYGIVNQSGGKILVESELGKGTTFKVYLPRTDESLDSDRKEAQVAQAAGGTETILLVEDEDHVRRLFERQLREKGYKVLTAEGAEQALDLAEQYGSGIELLLTDVVMPQMSGLELAEVLTEVFPNLRVLFVSGYADEAARLSETQFHNASFLAKPFTADALAQKIRELLDPVQSV